MPSSRRTESTVEPHEGCLERACECVQAELAAAEKGRDYYSRRLAEARDFYCSPCGRYEPCDQCAPRNAVPCPHCGPLHDRVCRHPDGTIDKSPWTNAERDALRERIKRESPATVFAPSTAQMQDRFGARNRADGKRP